MEGQEEHQHQHHAGVWSHEYDADPLTLSSFGGRRPAEDADDFGLASSALWHEQRASETASATREMTSVHAPEAASTEDLEEKRHLHDPLGLFGDADIHPASDEEVTTRQPPGSPPHFNQHDHEQRQHQRHPFTFARTTGTPLPVQGRAGVQRPSSAAQVRRQLQADLQFGSRAARGATAWLRHAREREAPRSFSAPFDDTMRVAKLDGRIRTRPRRGRAQRLSHVRA